uniref:Large ribosomal subunit protein P2 n=1 Tax=Seriola lalandi dorsalis TaxID=1841481 RepID=A0A3B4YHF6_SERLL
MRYVAAYLLSALGGNENPEAKDIKKILESVGIEADDTRLDKVIAELKGKNVNEVITTGYSKLASMPAGGAVAAVASSAAAGSGGAAALLQLRRRRKRRKKSLRSPMTTWDSACSTKSFQNINKVYKKKKKPQLFKCLILLQKLSKPNLIGIQ